MSVAVFPPYSAEACSELPAFNADSSITADHIAIWANPHTGEQKQAFIRTKDAEKISIIPAEVSGWERTEWIWGLVDGELVILGEHRHLL